MSLIGCQFADLSNLFREEDLVPVYDGVTGPLVLLPLLGTALAAVGIRLALNLDEDQDTILRLAEEFARDKKHPRTATQEKCVVKNLGRCSGRGFAKSEELADKLADNANSFQKACRTYLLPANFNPGSSRQVQFFNGAYLNLFFMIQNCVDQLIESQLWSKIDYCNTGEFKIADVCVERRTIDNQLEP